MPYLLKLEIRLKLSLQCFEMGNSEPSNSKLNTYIETEKPFYNSGSFIQGTVFVEAKDNFQFDALFIRVQGDQFCQWFEGSSKNRRKFTGNQNFYTQEHMLCKYQNGLQQGKYLYPFSMEISENIPGSFESTAYDARIRYKLIAYFANFDNAAKRHYYETPLIIRQPFRQQPSQYEGKVTTQPKTFFLFSKGDISIEAHFMRNVCFEGERIPIRINVDNSMGKADVKRIAVNLTQYTFVSANNGAFRTYKKIIDTQYINKRVPKGSKVDDLEMNFEVNSKKNIAQTAISTLVANYYRLEAYADIGAVAKDQPCIYCPIFIMKKSYKYEKNPAWSKTINEGDFKNKQKVQVFHAPQYWFRKNKNLDLMNFRVEDNVPIHETDHFI